MPSSTPLTGSVLIDCVKANAKSERVAITQRCGYGSDVAAFQAALQAACAEIGIAIEDFADLMAKNRQNQLTSKSIEISPDTTSAL